MAVTPVNWPAVLPDCPQDWRESDSPDVLSSGVDIGLPKIRRRSTLLNRSVNIQWTMTADLYLPFMIFYETTTEQGVIPFYYAHPVTGIVNAYRFSEPPQRTFIKGRQGIGYFRVNAVLELQE